RHQLLESQLLGLVQLRHPLPARLPLAAVDLGRGRSKHSAEDCSWIAGDSQRNIAVLANGTVILVDLNQGQIIRDALAVSHAEVERRTDDNDEVCVLERQ